MTAEPATESAQKRGTPYPPTRTDADIRALALAMVHGHVIDATSVPKRLVPMVFLPLLQGPFAGWSDEQMREVIVFGVITDESTLDRGINGYPVFRHIHLWRIDCFSRALVMAALAIRAYEAVTGPDPLHHPGPDEDEPAPAPAGQAAPRPETPAPDPG